jgi:hypothetical protein
LTEWLAGGLNEEQRTFSCGKGNFWSSDPFSGDEPALGLKMPSLVCAGAQKWHFPIDR